MIRTNIIDKEDFERLKRIEDLYGEGKEATFNGKIIDIHYTEAGEYYETCASLDFIFEVIINHERYILKRSMFLVTNALSFDFNDYSIIKECLKNIVDVSVIDAYISKGNMYGFSFYLKPLIGMNVSIKKEAKDPLSKVSFSIENIDLLGNIKLKELLNNPLSPNYY